MVGDFFEDDLDDADAAEKERRKEHNRRQRELTDFIIDFAKNHAEQKPIVVTINMYGGDLYSARSAVRLREILTNAGVPAYSTPESAARALAHYVQYHEYQDQRGG
jgi:acyl-CoA synthetase (NDP forming)